ncbi:M20 aminoacylase family protein [Enterobacter hormaechei]|uniref:M20 aminoacylase family protein n=1 Tax=Enterobacter hormaechei TaxID=158836 RepID=UPI0005EFD5E3|nr:M20 aminoacylase family protein [Enterobacter hormaechei]MCU3015835.1 M20 family metallopeptidase [Enterobacter hormaechei subsp. oharae]EHF4952483.1 amidohydrolase [Enterobacter hormaechei]EHF5016767.1 amidohydrolase [Enterobacter hormaechei]EHN8809963.1 amidohydrolase [Enterobacter hormaechei]EKK5499787.1 amidohydrolase [Enterobacter hormaechei]
MTHPIIEALRGNEARFTELRRYFHQHPEIGFEEHNTSDRVAALLQEWGYEVHRGLAKTGVVGTLKVGNGHKRLGLRADMDALPMQENNGKAWSSTVEGKFHGCGHDGHTTTLLYAAEYLARTRNFNGTLHLIFQPAEELLYGGRVMVEDGLFDLFPCDHIFGLHNMPSQPLGKIGLRDGAMMASSDTLHIEVNGVGGHGAVPEHTVDATLVACHITIALQSIVSRNITPFQPAVVTVGSIQAGHAPNIINDKVLMKLTVRTLDESVRQTVLQRIHDIAVAQAESFNATATIRHINGSPVLKNNPQANEMVRSVATDLFGQDAVAEVNAFMGSEDFAFMLEKNPNGCYFTLGAGDEPDRCMVHNPGYDFNDNILLTGAALWAALTEHYLR